MPSNTLIHLNSHDEQAAVRAKFKNGQKRDRARSGSIQSHVHMYMSHVHMYMSHVHMYMSHVHMYMSHVHMYMSHVHMYMSHVVN